MRRNRAEEKRLRAVTQKWHDEFEAEFEDADYVLIVGGANLIIAASNLEEPEARNLLKQGMRSFANWVREYRAEQRAGG